MSRTILIMDGLNCFYRSFVVDPSVTDKGELIGGCKGFLKQLQKACREMEPDEIHIAWDGEGGSRRRKKLKEDYKDGRKPVRAKHYNRFLEQDMTEDQEKENKAWQLSRLIEYLNYMPINQYMFPNIEADDVIAALVNHHEFQEDYKIIFSNDKDFLQLLDDKTVVYRPATKKALNKYDILEQYEIHPNNMALARAIAGDRSDNLPGIKGVGLKTLANRFPTLTGSQRIYYSDLVDDIESRDKELKIFDRIKEGKEVIDLNYKMMQLYAPKISAEVRTQIDNMVSDDHEYVWNWVQIQRMMLKDGFGSYSWVNLKKTFNKIIRSTNDR